MSDEQPQAHLWDLLKDAGFGMLITQDGETIRSRPMDANIDAEAGLIHFMTKRTAAKVEELHHDRDIAVAFANGSDGTYISVSGRGTVSTNMELIEKCWDAGAEAWFGDGNGKSDVAVITLHPTQAEYWDNDQSLLVSAYEFGKGYFTNEAPDMGENAKVKLGGAA